MVVMAINVYMKVSLDISEYTTRFHSFTDGTIPPVYNSEFVSNFFIDDILDRNLPSIFLSSIIPNSVATSVGKKKKKQLLMVLQKEIARQKKNHA